MRCSVLSTVFFLGCMSAVSAGERGLYFELSQGAEEGRLAIQTSRMRAPVYLPLAGNTSTICSGYRWDFVQTNVGIRGCGHFGTVAGSSREEIFYDGYQTGAHTTVHSDRKYSIVATLEWMPGEVPVTLGVYGGLVAARFEFSSTAWRGPERIQRSYSGWGPGAVIGARVQFYLTDRVEAFVAYEHIRHTGKLSRVVGQDYETLKVSERTESIRFGFTVPVGRTTESRAHSGYSPEAAAALWGSVHSN